MSLLKLHIHIILQVLHPSALSKILPQCQVLIPSLLNPFALLRCCTAFLSRQSLSWAVSLLPASSSCLIPTSSPLCTPLPCLCLWLCSGILYQHPVPGNRATGATSTSIPMGLLAPSSILLVAWGASGLCSFLDISSWCWPRETHNPSSQIPVEIHSINLSTSHIKKPLKRYLYLLCVIPHSCWVSSASNCLLLHQQVFFI